VTVAVTGVPFTALLLPFSPPSATIVSALSATALLLLLVALSVPPALPGSVKVTFTFSVPPSSPSVGV